MLAYRVQRSPFTKIWLLNAFLLSVGLAVSAQEQSYIESAVDMSTCAEQPFSIDLAIHKVRKSEGVITVDLHNDNPEGWINKEGRIGRIRTPATEDVTRVCIPLNGPGTYAIALYHDKDANDEFNKNFLGIPSEPFGISNDPRIGLSAPPYEKSSFLVQGPATPVKVTLRGS